MTTLTSFIADIATNPALQTAYTLSPENTMAGYGLTAVEIKAVLAGDKGSVENMTGKKSSATAYYFIDTDHIPAKDIHH